MVAAGIFFVLPCIESYTKVDLRTVSFDVPPQQVLTKDAVTVNVDAVVYYRVCNATVSVSNVEVRLYKSLLSAIFLCLSCRSFNSSLSPHGRRVTFVITANINLRVSVH